MPAARTLLPALALMIGAPAPVRAADEAADARLFIQEYRVEGARQLPRLAIEEAVYPFLGPGRTRDDVELARAALEKSYRDAGYQTVAVQIPPQEVKDGVVILQVVEATVARLRVKGAEYSSPRQIRAMAPSLAEGKVVNFNEVPRDIVALNQLPDRRVTPTLRAGEAPGTVDIDLDVKETRPIHANVELNNRRSAHTTALRLNGSFTDHNFLQRGQSLGLSFQVAPERLDDAKVFSGYYLARFANASAFTLLLQGVKQDSNVSTLGGIAVAGRGETLGARGMLRLPGGKDYFQSVSLGFDYKHFDQDLTVGGKKLVAPITYYPLSALYSLTAIGEGRATEFNAGVTLHLRGLGSSPSAFDARRYQADGGFLYFRGDVAHTHDLRGGGQLFAKLQGQIASQALLDSEEYSGGGLGTVRGYLESEVVGDNGAFVSLEARSRAFGRVGNGVGEWRLHVFTDAGVLTLRQPLPEQKARFTLASVGLGGRVRLRDRISGSLDAGAPLIRQVETKPGELRFTFRLWADF